MDSPPANGGGSRYPAVPLPTLPQGTHHISPFPGIFVSNLGLWRPFVATFPSSVSIADCIQLEMLSNRQVMGEFTPLPDMSGRFSPTALVCSF